MFWYSATMLVHPSSAFLVLVVFTLVVTTRVVKFSGAPSSRGRTKYFRLNESEALDYLRRFGYLQEDMQQPDQSQITKTAIARFQRKTGLTQSGELNEETLEQMSKPRCGVTDFAGIENKFTAVARWDKKSLTYFISVYPSSRRLTTQQVDQEIARAFKVWSDYTDLTFRVANRWRDERPDIDIRFLSFNHGDGSPFDGTGGTLGHAFFPPQGKVHMDDSEPWTLYSHNGVNLFQVAAHEFGHSLGLDHSEVRSALMAPYYLTYVPTFRLDNDDIRGIQYIYGRKAKSVVPVGLPRTTSNHSMVNGLCQNLAFDTIFTDLQNVTYVIKGSQYWVLGSIGTTLDVQRKWPGLPGHIDAAFSHQDLAKTYFFSGAQVWRFDGDKLDMDYPKLISERFPKIPDNLDTAFVWSNNKQIYFFKGKSYWKFDYTTLPAVAYEYPRQTGAWWLGVPDAPGAAFARHGRSYFAKDGNFARLDDRTLKADSAGYRCVRVLFECPNASTKCLSSLKHKTWMEAIKRSRSEEHNESSRPPNHWGCMKHQGCRNIP